MRRSRRLLLLLAVFFGAFVLAAVATFPARLAYRLAGTTPTAIACRGIRGTVWRGHAESCLLLGRLRGRLSWYVETTPRGLWALLRSTPRLRLDWHGRRTRLRARVRLARPLSVHRLRGVVPLRALEAFLPSLALFGAPHGELVVRRLDLRLGPNRLGPLSGSARLLRTRLGGPLALPLGTLVVSARKEGTASVLTIRTPHPRTLSLDARFRLEPSGAYRLTATLAAAPGAPPSLAAFLAGLPPGPRPGTRIFRSSGLLRLPEFLP